MLPQTAVQLLLFVNILYQQNATKQGLIDKNNNVIDNSDDDKQDVGVPLNIPDEEDVSRIEGHKDTEDVETVIPVKIPEDEETVTPEEEGGVETDAVILKKISGTLTKVLDKVNNENDWVLKSKSPLNEDKIFAPRAKQNPKLTTLMAESVLEVDTDTLFDDLWNKAADTPKWNPTVSNVTIIRTIGDNTRVMYQTTAPAAGGAVASREFVNYNAWFLVNGTYYLVYESAPDNYLPDSEVYVRAFNGPSALILSPSKDNPGNTDFKWLMSCNFRFTWFGSNLVTKIMPTVMMEYLNSMRKHVKELAQ